MQTAESSNAALTGRVSLPVPVYPDLDAQGTEQKKSSNKPEEQETGQIRKRDMRVKLARDLWEQYQKPTLTIEQKIKIATILAKLTDRGKPSPAKALFK